MGLFDKLTDATKKMTRKMENTVTQVVETSTTKAKEVLGGVVGVTNGNTDGAPKAPSYIPHFSPLAQTVPVQNPNDAVREAISPVQATDREFPLESGVLRIPASMDAFNSYRKMFRKLAINCVKLAEAEYAAKVQNYISFVEDFPRIYDEHLYPMLQMALDILVANNIWSITFEELALAHKQNFHLAIDDYSVMEQSTAMTIENNRQMTAGVFSVAADLIGGQLGDVGSSSLFDGLKQGGMDAAVGNTGIEAAQQEELFGRICLDDLFANVYADYTNVFLTLVAILKNNGHDIWLLDSCYVEEAANIFKNLSNPNFPQDKVVDVLIDILDSNPYDSKYYQFMVSRFGETDQVTAIREYFGYTDFNDPRMC